MKRLSLPFLFFALLGLFYAGCSGAGDDGGSVRLTGQVVDAADAPVEGALIRVPATAEMSDQEDVVAMTKADGTYSLNVDIETSTDLQVIASKDGFTQETVVTVIAGKAREVPPLVLVMTAGAGGGSGQVPQGTATLTGQVVDGTGAPAADVVVRAKAGTSEPVRTDAEGNYTLVIGADADGEVDVEASLNGYTASRTVTMLLDETVEVALLVLPYPEVVGSVTLAGQVVDESGAPVAGASVEVPSTPNTTSGTAAATQTDAQGRYELTVGMRTGGDLTVKASKDGFTGEHTLTAFPNTDRTVPTLVLSASEGEGGTVSLTGRVVDRDGVPVADARVSVAPTPETTSTTPVTTRTDEEGHYELTVGLRTGTDLTVSADRDGYEASATVTVFAGDTRSVPELVLPFSSSEPGSYATLEGQVVNRNGDPVADARVHVPADELVTVEDATARTDAEGAYALPVIIDSNTELTVTATKDGYEASTTVTVFAGDTRQVPTLVLPFPDETTPEPGVPTNIQLVSVTPSVIGIVGSGAPEVARITFQLTDSTGTPVTLGSGAAVRFRLGQSPSGVFVAPQEMETNSEGKVTANLSSGTQAGTVQVVAEATVGGETIFSHPVTVVIHGGMPDLEHFSIGPAQFNFPGLRRYGVSDEISVIVGDRYSNPVKEGTAVYFETTHGVIEGSAFTDEMGHGAVTLTSANPLPSDGIAVITASTANDNEERIARQTPVVFSGVPNVVVSPTTASLYETYSVSLTDENGNPLAPGTTVSVQADGTKVKATGNVNVTLDDTAFRDGNGDGDALDYEDVIRGPGVTEFTFRAVDDLEPDEAGSPTLETISILVSGPNGSLEIVLTPDGPQATSTAVMQRQSDGTVLFQPKERVDASAW